MKSAIINGYHCATESSSDYGKYCPSLLSSKLDPTMHHSKESLAGWATIYLRRRCVRDAGAGKEQNTGARGLPVRHSFLHGCSRGVPVVCADTALLCRVAHEYTTTDSRGQCLPESTVEQSSGCEPNFKWVRGHSTVERQLNRNSQIITFVTGNISRHWDSWWIEPVVPPQRKHTETMESESWTYSPSDAIVLHHKQQSESKQKEYPQGKKRRPGAWIMLRK